MAFPGEFAGEWQQKSEASQPLFISSAVTSAIAAMSHWAGESVDSVTWIQTAAETVHELVDEAEQYLRR